MTDDNYEILVKNIEMLMQNKNMIPADLIRETGIAQSQVIGNSPDLLKGKLSLLCTA